MSKRKRSARLLTRKGSATGSLSHRHISRRNFLGGSSALFGAMGLGLPALLSKQARAQVAGAKRLVLITCTGGWDVTFHLDPKQNNIATLDVPIGQIITSGDLTYFNAATCNGVVDDFFTAHSDVASIVRGISVRSISHDECIKRMLTGTTQTEAPDMGVITGAVHGPDLPAPYLTLGTVSFPGRLSGASVRTGFTNQLALAHTHGDLDPNVGAIFPNAEEQALIAAYIGGQGDVLAASARAQYGLNAQRAADYQSSRVRAAGLAANKDALGPAFQTAFTLQDQIDAALTMFERDAAWAVNLSTGFVWDHHDGSQAPTGTYDGGQGLRNQELWPQLSYLADELKSRDGSTPGSKLIDETVVVVLSEMTRTPLKNATGGKDHWPYTSALVFGGGALSGRSVGASDNTLVSVPVDFDSGAPSGGGAVLEASNFVAGIVELCGVDAATYFPNTAPFRALTPA